MPGTLTATQIFWGTVIVAGGTVAYQKHESDDARKDARKKEQETARRQRQANQEALEAGEYWADVNRQQMELQAQSSNIKMLADILEEADKPADPQIITLPSATTFSPVEKINQAIEDFLGGL